MTKSDQTELLERIANATDTLVRLIVRQLAADMSQKDAIIMLDQMGCAPGDIAGYLNVPPTSVYPTLSRAKKSVKK